MHNRFKHTLLATCAAVIPATLLAHNTANKGLEGLGTLFAILVIIMAVGVLTLVLTIVNVFKKNRTLRIVCIALTIPYLLISLYTFTSINSAFPAFVTLFMVFLIYKSIPQKTPLHPTTDNTEIDTEDTQNTPNP